MDSASDRPLPRCRRSITNHKSPSGPAWRVTVGRDRNDPSWATVVNIAVRIWPISSPSFRVGGSFSRSACIVLAPVRLTGSWLANRCPEFIRGASSLIARRSMHLPARLPVCASLEIIGSQGATATALDRSSPKIRSNFREDGPVEALDLDRHPLDRFDSMTYSLVGCRERFQRASLSLRQRQSHTDPAARRIFAAAAP